MPENWTAIVADVVAAIADIGFSVTINRKTGGGANPWDSAVPTIVPLTCKAIDRKPSYSRMAGASEGATGRGLLVAPGPNVPAIGDMVTVRGAEHAVMSVEAVAPGGVDLLFIVELAA